MRHAPRVFLRCLPLLVLAAARADEAADQFNFATGLLIRNEPRLAAEEFRKLLDRQPPFAQADVACYRLGEALQKAGDTNGSQAAFERLLRDFPRSERVPSGRYMLGQLLAARDPRAAAAHYAAVAADSPLAEPACFGRAEALYQASDWTNAAAAYGAVLQKYAGGRYAPQALYSRAWSLLQSGDAAAAAQDFLAFVQKFPTNDLAAECRLKAADSLRLSGRLEEALPLYEQVRAGGGRLAAEALSGRAWTLYGRREFAAALDAFREAARALGTDARAAACVFNAGNAAFELRRFGEAAALFAQVGRDLPAGDLARPSLYWQALCLVRAGRPQEAVPLLEELRRPAPPADLAAESAVLLAEAQAAGGKAAEAAALYAAVLRDFPAHPLAAGAAAGRVLALEKAGDLPAAEAAAAAYGRQFPAGSQAESMRFLTGEYRYRQGRYAEAAPVLESFACDHPTNEFAAAALHKAALARWHLRNTSQARVLFASVAVRYAASPLAADAAYMAGRAAEEAGDAPAAASNYTDAVRLGKDNDSSQRAAVELIRLDLAAKRHDAALAAADAFLAAHREGAARPRAQLYRGEALLELARPGEALQAYRAVDGAGDAATAASAAYGAAWALRRLARPAEAADAFGVLAAGASSYAADAAFWQARSLEDAGRLDEAGARYAACAQAKPAGPRADEAAYRQAWCAWQRKQDDAARLYQAVLDNRGASPFAANALYDLAWIALDAGRKDDARRQFEAFAGKHPQHALAPDARFRAAEIAYEKEDFAAAGTAYEAVAAAADVPFRDKALYKLGWTRERQKQDDAALAAYERLAKEHPQSDLAPEARYRAGRIRQAQGKFDEAAAAFAAVTGGPFAEHAAFFGAECLRSLGRNAAAEAAYGQVLARWQQGECHVQALLGRGHARRALERLDEAVGDYRAVARATETVDAAQALLGEGYCLYAQKKWDDAAKAFLKVDILYAYEELKPEALAMIAKTWEAAGDAAKAAVYRADLRKRYPAARQAQE